MLLLLLEHNTDNWRKQETADMSELAHSNFRISNLVKPDNITRVPTFFTV